MNYHLLSLAIADFGVLLIIYPVVVCKYLKPFKWLLGKRAYLYMLPTNEIFFGASIWSITAIAIERYRNIVGAKRYQFGKRSGLKTAIGIFAVWLASFLVLLFLCTLSRRTNQPYHYVTLTGLTGGIVIHITKLSSSSGMSFLWLS